MRQRVRGGRALLGEGVGYEMCAERDRVSGACQAW